MDPKGKIPLLVVTGPTASGKSALAIRLASKFGSEIISADSMQVYRGFDIGTAKPGREELSKVPHHLIDVADPTENYSAGRFREEAAAAVERIHGSGRSVIVAGGTVLYLKVLLEGLIDAPPSDPRLRAELSREWDAGGGPGLFSELMALDPVLAARLHPNDRARIIRGIEVGRTAGVPLSALQSAHVFSERPYRWEMIGMEVPRDLLYEKINERVDQMMAAGWLEEVRSLLDRGVPPDAPPFKSIGYAELVRHLTGDAPLDCTVDDIKKATRNFAKRQLTWMRKMNIRWIRPGETEAAFKVGEKFFGEHSSEMC